jgi:uncharacterized coiled-coil protein SlyX
MDKLQQLIELIAKEWAVISQAPVTFLSAAVMVGFLVWLALRSAFELRIANLESTIKLKDETLDNYRAKLDGATPEEAQKRIAAMERQIQALHDPRRLNEDQEATLAQALREWHGYSIKVTRDVSSGETAGVQGQVRRLFERCGWRVEHYAAMGVGGGDKLRGLILLVHPEPRPAFEHAVIEAFRAANVPFDLIVNRSEADVPQLIFTDM